MAEEINWDLCILCQEKKPNDATQCSGRSHKDGSAPVQAYVVLCDVLKEYDKANALQLPPNVEL